ncbi:hypothetical protein BCEN4_1210006 [Burkholderia cenocepacia]|nr:hypothetical protein BCEN4_1210006 [Burkholderia cenocepacia]
MTGSPAEHASFDNSPTIPTKLKSSFGIRENPSCRQL